MNVEYKNKTGKDVNIRGLVIAPGASRTSQVLIEHFEGAVESGELSMIIDDGYRKLEVKPVKAEAPAAETPAANTGSVTPPDTAVIPPDPVVTPPDPVTVPPDPPAAPPDTVVTPATPTAEAVEEPKDKPPESGEPVAQNQPPAETPTTTEPATPVAPAETKKPGKNK